MIFDQYLAFSLYNMGYIYSYYGMRIPKLLNGTSLMTLNDLNPNLKVTPLFNAKYLKNGTRYRYSYNGIGTYTRHPRGVISNDHE